MFSCCGAKSVKDKDLDLSIEAEALNAEGKMLEDGGGLANLKAAKALYEKAIKLASTDYVGEESIYLSGPISRINDSLENVEKKIEAEVKVEEKVEKNADPENPEKTELIESKIEFFFKASPD